MRRNPTLGVRRAWPLLCRRLQLHARALGEAAVDVEEAVEHVRQNRLAAQAPVRDVEAQQRVDEKVRLESAVARDLERALAGIAGVVVDDELRADAEEIRVAEMFLFEHSAGSELIAAVLDFLILITNTTTTTISFSCFRFCSRF